MERIIEYAQGKGATFCDVRKEKEDKTHIILHNNDIKVLKRGEEIGFMVRILHGNGWGYMGSSNLDAPETSARKALSMAKGISRVRNEKTGLSEVKVFQEEKSISMKKHIWDVSPEEKVLFLQELKQNLEEPCVHAIELDYHDTMTEKEICSSEGTRIRMTIPRVCLSVTVTGKRGTLQRAVEKIGGTGGMEVVQGAYDRKEVIIDRLQSLLQSRSPPRGHMPLIMDPHLTGIFIHEALGHAAEGDVITGNHSCLEEKIGEKIAAESVTIRDDPTVDGYGRYPFDDEGTRAVPRTLIKDGICNDYILDRESAWKLGKASNGGARAEDFRVPPLVRMSNTIMEPGTYTFHELMEDMGTGIYAQSSSGGEVNPAQGTFQFTAQLAYTVEHGEIGEPLRNVSFSGSILEVLHTITGLSKDSDMRCFECGKGQSVPVSSGGPHVLLSAISVGGRA